MNPAVPAVPAVHTVLASLVQNFLILQGWNSLPVVIILLMFQDIHPNIIYELLPHFQMSRRQVRNIILAMMQLRLFSSSFLPDIRGLKNLSYRCKSRMIQQNPHNWIFRQFYCFRCDVFLRLLTKSRFDRTLDYTGRAVRDFISNFVVFRTSPIFPIGQFFLSQNNDLIFLKTACEMILLFEHVRSSYPEIVLLLAQNEFALEEIIRVWKTQMCINTKGYYKSGKICDVTYSGNITVHPLHDLFVFCIFAITRPDFIDKKLRFFIENFGDRSKLHHQDPYDPKSIILLMRNLVTRDIRYDGTAEISVLLNNLREMLNSQGALGAKYELRPAPATSGIYQIHDPHFECLTREVDRHQPMFGVFKIFLEVFFRNFARTFEESGRRVLLPLPPMPIRRIAN